MSFPCLAQKSEQPLWGLIFCFPQSCEMSYCVFFFPTAHKAYCILALGCFSSVTPRHSFTSVDTNCVPGPELDTGDIKAGNFLQSALSLQTSLQARSGLLLLFHAFAPGVLCLKFHFTCVCLLTSSPLYHLWQLSPTASSKQCKCLLYFYFVFMCIYIALITL